ncbi:type VI secretion system secreted protein Hcp [Roseibium hamelinense]|uniref:Type VI secretion system secreted protein Hcp n=1 Tax=Roseibium hamelinense TaxID=150831 RepID=A0A562TJ33_9HYPH|nr:Hcp family type VI secretion system effector [Roseibium hamelinense]TWI93258.1 type VI secretion system secreted protein Hcp [Roseibium hamelinense]
MANVAYAKISGATQGDISKDATTADSIGNSWQEGHEDECLVYNFEMNAIVPRDPNSGTAIGTRRHQPSSFIKPLDKASPLLWQALATGENLEIEVAFWRTSTAGQQEHYFTVKYTDAVLVEGKHMLPDVNDDKNASRGDLDQWFFSYRKAEWTHEKAGTSGSDDWRAPVTS